MKNGDIFRWSYNSEWLKRKGDGDNGGTTYWAVSRIAIVDGDYLVDTWSSSMNTSFTKDMIDERLELVFIANMGDLDEACKSDRACYMDADCVDISHANSWGMNFYLRKGAKKSVLKMEKVIKRKKYDIEHSIEYQLQEINRLENDLLTLNEDTHINCNKETPMSDDHYIDYELEPHKIAINPTSTILNT